MINEKNKDISSNLDLYFSNTYKKVAVSFSGGLESLLMLLICIKRYGEENVFAFHQKHTVTDSGTLPLYHIYSKFIIKKLNFHNYYEIDIDITGDKSLDRHRIKDCFILQIWNTIPKLDKIFIGVNNVRYGYCSCQEFLNQLKTGLKNFSQVSTPFLELYKEDTIKGYYDLGYQEYISLTRSCHKPYNNHCGVCSNCLDRKNGFEIAGKKDPIIYKDNFTKS